MVARTFTGADKKRKGTKKHKNRERGGDEEKKGTKKKAQVDRYYSGVTTSDLYSKQNAFYVQCIAPAMTYSRIVPGAPPLRVRDLEARFAPPPPPQK